MRTNHAILIIPFILAAVVNVTQAEVIHGFQALEPTELANWGAWAQDAFDFDTRTIVTPGSPAADLVYGEDEKSMGWWFQLFNCQGAEIYDKTLEQVLAAPDKLVELGGQSLSSKRPNPGVFVIKTDDNLYAKFSVRNVYDGINGNGGCCSMVIEYYVQTDGSPSFGPLLASEPSTWGRVKALYR